MLLCYRLESGSELQVKKEMKVRSGCQHRKAECALSRPHRGERGDPIPVPEWCESGVCVQLNIQDAVCAPGASYCVHWGMFISSDQMLTTPFSTPERPACCSTLTPA